MDIGYQPELWPGNEETDFRKYSEWSQLFVCLNTQNLAIGFALLDIFDGNAHLEELDVDPEFHRQGAAKLLMSHIIEWARQKKLKYMTLRTFNTTRWSVNLYQKYGFEIIDDATFPHITNMMKSEFNMPMPDRITMGRVI